jgi:hypothetical protein
VSDFEVYSNELLDSAKRFLLEAKSYDKDSEIQRNLRSALTHAFFFLEAQLNYLSNHFANRPEFSILERSLLCEREFVLHKGRFVLTDKQKFFRLEDRVEFLLAKFAQDPSLAKGSWFSELTSAIQIRNRLVHPKTVHKIKVTEVEKAIRAILECLTSLYLAIFKKEFPPSKLGLGLGPSD